TYGLPFLSHSFYNSRREITLWSTAEAIPRLKKSLEAYDLREEDRYLNINFKKINTDGPEKIKLADDLSVETLPTDHSRPGIGLKLCSDGYQIIYSSDTTPTEDIKNNSQETDVLIHDCQSTEAYRRYFKKSHTSARQLGNIAREIGAKAVVPFHYNTTEIPVTFPEIAAEIREEYSGTIIQAKKGTAFYF
ncbi:MAG: MBL fold metallo-hydrolase, partial [bacterium]